MNLSLELAKQLVGPTYTLGLNKHGAVLVVFPGHLTFEEAQKAQTEQSKNEYGAIVNIRYERHADSHDHVE